MIFVANRFAPFAGGGQTALALSLNSFGRPRTPLRVRMSVCGYVSLFCLTLT